MNREQFIAICDSRLRMLRSELSLSQDKMAFALGISKKTLVEIEKERSSLGWTGAVALCAVFGQSETLLTAFGGRTDTLISSLAFDGLTPPDTVSRNPINKLLWETVRQTDEYTIEQNIISLHYRLLDGKSGKIASSFDIEDLEELIASKDKS